MTTSLAAPFAVTFAAIAILIAAASGAEPQKPTTAGATQPPSSTTYNSRTSSVPSAPPARPGAPVQLPPVEVTATQQQLYNSIDRKVYNVGKDIVSTTGSASDLLQNVPSIQVDVDGEVSLRGDSSVQILINGKPSAMLSRNRAAALEQMPAGEIERVEIITNPSARFRPDGTGGVINLVMKKGRVPGHSGSVRANVGNEERYNASVSASFNPGRYTLYGSASLRQDTRPYFADEDRARFDAAGQSLSSTTQQSSTERSGLNRFVRLGADYKLDDATKIGASFDYDDRRSNRDVTQRTVSRNGDGAVTHNYDRLRDGDERDGEFEFAISFNREYSGREHELQAELRLGQAEEEEDNRYTNLFRTPEALSTLDTTRVRNTENDLDISVDYERGIGSEAKLELGYEGEREKTDLDFSAATVDSLSGDVIPDVPRTNRFIYEGTIHSLYATYGQPFGKLGILAGLRLEHAIVDTNQVTTQIAARNDYSRLYPTLHLNYRFNDAHQLQLSYSHRVNRPDEDELNPFILYDDPFNLRAGNPALVPENVHSIEAGYQYDHDESSYLASLYVRRRENGFTEVTRALDGNTLLTTDENLATSESFGLELGATTRLMDRIALNFSANAYHQEIDAENLGFRGRRSTIAWDAKLNSNWEVTDRLMVQLTTGYRASRLTAQGERHPSLITNLGLRYDLKDKRTSVILTVSDVFKTLRDRTTLDTPLLRGDITRRRSSQVIYLGVIFNFGRSAKSDNNLEFDEAL